MQVTVLEHVRVRIQRSCLKKKEFIREQIQNIPKKIFIMWSFPMLG